MRQTKRLFLLLCMTLAITANAYANKKHAKEINCMANVENANGKEHKWEKIMDAIIQVESGGNPNAKGGNSLGILQITPMTSPERNMRSSQKSMVISALQKRLTATLNIQMCL